MFTTMKASTVRAGGQRDSPDGALAGGLNGLRAGHARILPG
jgi:hypothetical protein